VTLKTTEEPCCLRAAEAIWLQVQYFIDEEELEGFGDPFLESCLESLVYSGSITYWTFLTSFALTCKVSRKSIVFYWDSLALIRLRVVAIPILSGFIELDWLI